MIPSAPFAVPLFPLQTGRPVTSGVTSSSSSSRGGELAFDDAGNPILTAHQRKTLDRTEKQFQTRAQQTQEERKVYADVLEDICDEQDAPDDENQPDLPINLEDGTLQDEPPLDPEQERQIDAQWTEFLKEGLKKQEGKAGSNPRARGSRRKKSVMTDPEADLLAMDQELSQVATQLGQMILFDKTDDSFQKFLQASEKKAQSKLCRPLKPAERALLRLAVKGECAMAVRTVKYQEQQQAAPEPVLPIAAATTADTAAATTSKKDQEPDKTSPKENTNSKMIKSASVVVRRLPVAPPPPARTGAVKRLLPTRALLAPDDEEEHNQDGTTDEMRVLSQPTPIIARSASTASSSSLISILESFHRSMNSPLTVTPPPLAPTTTPLAPTTTPACDTPTVKFQQKQATPPSLVAKLATLGQLPTRSTSAPMVSSATTKTKEPPKVSASTTNKSSATTAKGVSTTVPTPASTVKDPLNRERQRHRNRQTGGKTAPTTSRRLINGSMSGVSGLKTQEPTARSIDKKTSVQLTVPAVRWAYSVPSVGRRTPKS